MDKMRVLACPASWFLSDSFGSEPTWAYEIMEHCHRIHDIEYAAFCNSADIERPTPGIEIVELGADRGKTLWGTARFLSQCLISGRRRLRGSSFDVVHHIFPFGYEEGLDPIALLHSQGVRSFVLGPIQLPQRLTHHSDFELTMNIPETSARIHQSLERAGSRILRPMTRPLQRKTLAQADRLVFDGEATRRLYHRAYEGLDPSRSVVIPQGVDTETYRPTVPFEERPPEIMTASYFTQRKGLEVLIRALPLIVRERPEVMLRACGRGPMLDHARVLVKQLGVAGHVVFEGFVAYHDLVSYFPRARVYVQPSYSETLPSAVLQALSCGTPVVATRVGLMPEYLGSMEAASLVEPGNPEALAEAILVSLDAPSNREGEARRYAERHHGWRVLGERWVRVYEDAIASA